MGSVPLAGRPQGMPSNGGRPGHPGHPGPPRPPGHPGHPRASGSAQSMAHSQTSDSWWSWVSWVSRVSWQSWPGARHAQRLRAFPVAGPRLFLRRQAGGAPSQTSPPASAFLDVSSAQILPRSSSASPIGQDRAGKRARAPKYAPDQNPNFTAMSAVPSAVAETVNSSWLQPGFFPSHVFGPCPSPTVHAPFCAPHCVSVSVLPF